MIDEAHNKGISNETRSGHRHCQFADGARRPIYDDGRRQSVIDDGYPVYGVWLIPEEEPTQSLIVPADEN
jgi:hypothetical protein